jgi:hypothetical protein
MGWTLERYLNSTIYEFNEAAGGYWRNWERQTGWITRELVWTLIAGNPDIEKSSKPSKKDQLYKFSIDKEEVKKVKRIDPKKIQQDIKVMEAMGFSSKK